jgi:hypothetical protein
VLRIVYWKLGRKNRFLICFWVGLILNKKLFLTFNQIAVTVLPNLIRLIYLNLSLSKLRLQRLILKFCTQKLKEFLLNLAESVWILLSQKVGVANHSASIKLKLLLLRNRRDLKLKQPMLEMRILQHQHFQDSTRKKVRSFRLNFLTSWLWTLFENLVNLALSCVQTY